MNEAADPMSDQTIQVRRLTSVDAVLYRALRLEALLNHPEAFGSTHDAEDGKPIAWFAERLDLTAVFGAFRDSVLVGLAGFQVQDGPKVAHKGKLWGMYVRPDARKSHVGTKLVEAVLDHARQFVELIQLTVVSENKSARALYQSFGFSEYGLEKDALKQGERTFDEVLMVKRLSV
jgi:ribosomal protein S18 acetylase RimI-like enzyme